MSSRIARGFFGCVLFSMFGLCVEIVFTGLIAGWGESFRGQVSLLMIPVYSTAYLLVGPLVGVLERAGAMRPAVRLPLTVLVIYAIEWSFGVVYGAAGLVPWHYDHGWASAFSGGTITLYYLPFWLLFALVVVPAWRIVRQVATSLSAGNAGGEGSMHSVRNAARTSTPASRVREPGSI